MSGFIDHTIQDPLAKLKDAWMKMCDSEDYFDAQYQNHIRVVSVEIPKPGSAKVQFELDVVQAICNRANNLHGGAVASIFDITTSVALVALTKPGFWEFLGVTRSLNCTYLGPSPVGNTYIIECEVVQIGKRMVHLTGKIKGQDGSIKCLCDHMKINSDPPML